MRDTGGKFLAKVRDIIQTMVILAMVPAMTGCEQKKLDTNGSGGPEHITDFPPYITPNEKYFDVRIDGIPTIDPESYELRISGLINEPVTLSLEDLRNLDMIEKTVTVECIGNPARGDLIGTAVWKGFSVYDMLASLGIKDEAAAVNYRCADGYYTYHTLEELQTGQVIGALFMNGTPIPELYGFPLRAIFPGYHGVRQPGWIVEMELVSGEGDDYSTRYKIDSAMAPDTRIFFPVDNEQFVPGESIRIGGAAYGGKRISRVEITADDGGTWIPAVIRDSLDQDHAWVFWEAVFTPQSKGTVTIHARATAQDGRVQPREDSDIYDGINSWPGVTIAVK